ncbi:NAD-dependent deacetylase hst3 [Rhodotorula toruloides]
MLTLELEDFASTSDCTLEALAHVAVSLADSSAQVVAAVGAGISTSAGIPDFRGSCGIYSSSSPTSSLSSPHPPPSTPRSSQATKHLFSYSSLVHPESRSEHFRFMGDLRKAARKAGKGKERADEPPTAFHGLMKRLERSDKLMRVWSQNVDGLERQAGLDFVDFDDPSLLDARQGDNSYDSPDEESSSDYERPDWTPIRRGRKRRRLSPLPLSLHPPLSSATSERGKVVALHGSLDEVVCGVCRWREKWRKRHSKAFRKGKALPCPQCRGRAHSRLQRSKRLVTPSPLSSLRPSILLYDDSTTSVSSLSSLISSLAASDLSAGPDCLIVAGTSLRIPGFRRIVKDVARAARKRKGVCVFVNGEKVGKEWDEVFDYHFLGSTDTFATAISSFLDTFSPLPSQDSLPAALSSPAPSPRPVLPPLPSSPPLPASSAASEAGWAIPHTPPSSVVELSSPCARQEKMEKKKERGRKRRREIECAGPDGGQEQKRRRKKVEARLKSGDSPSPPNTPLSSTPLLPTSAPSLSSSSTASPDLTSDMSIAELLCLVERHTRREARARRRLSKAAKMSEGL